MKAKSIFRFADENSSVSTNSESERFFFDITKCANKIFYLNNRIQYRLKWITLAKRLHSQYNSNYTRKVYKLNRNYNSILEFRIKHYFIHWKIRFQWKELIKKAVNYSLKSTFQDFAKTIPDEKRQAYAEQWDKLAKKLVRESRIDNLLDIYSTEKNQKLIQNSFLSWKNSFNKHVSYIENLREDWETFSLYLLDQQRLKVFRKERRILKRQLKWFRLNHLLYIDNIEHEHYCYVLWTKWISLYNLIRQNHQRKSLIKARHRIQSRNTFKSFTYQILNLNHRQNIVSEYQSFLRKGSLIRLFKKYINLVRNEDLVEVYELYQKKLNEKKDKLLLKNYVKRWHIIAPILKYQRRFTKATFQGCCDFYYYTIADRSAKVIQKCVRAFINKRKESRKMLYHWFIKWRQTALELTYDSVEFPQMSLNVRLKKLHFSLNFDFLKRPEVSVLDVLHNVYQYQEIENNIKFATSKVLENTTFQYPAIPNPTIAIENVTSFVNISQTMDQDNSEILNGIMPKINLLIPNSLFSTLKLSALNENEIEYDNHSSFNYNELNYSLDLHLNGLFDPSIMRFLDTGILSNKSRKPFPRLLDIEFHCATTKVKDMLNKYQYPVSFPSIKILHDLQYYPPAHKNNMNPTIKPKISLKIPHVNTNLLQSLGSFEPKEEKENDVEHINAIEVSSVISCDFDFPLVNIRPLMHLNYDIEMEHIDDFTETTSLLLDSIIRNSFTLFTNKSQSISFLENTSNNITESNKIDINNSVLSDLCIPNLDDCFNYIPIKSSGPLNYFNTTSKIISPKVVEILIEEEEEDLSDEKIEEEEEDLSDERIEEKEDLSNERIEEEEEDYDSDIDVPMEIYTETFSKQIQIELPTPFFNSINSFSFFEPPEHKTSKEDISIDIEMDEMVAGFDFYKLNRSVNQNEKTCGFNFISLISGSLRHLSLFQFNTLSFTHQIDNNALNEISSRITQNKFQMKMPVLKKSLNRLETFQYHQKITHISLDDISQIGGNEFDTLEEEDILAVDGLTKNAIKSPRIILPSQSFNAINKMKSFELFRKNVEFNGFSEVNDILFQADINDHVLFENILSLEFERKKYFVDNFRIKKNKHCTNYPKETHIQEECEHTENLSNLQPNVQLNTKNDLGPPIEENESIDLSEEEHLDIDLLAKNTIKSPHIFLPYHSSNVLNKMASFEFGNKHAESNSFLNLNSIQLRIDIKDDLSINLISQGFERKQYLIDNFHVKKNLYCRHHPKESLIQEEYNCTENLSDLPINFKLSIKDALGSHISKNRLNSLGKFEASSIPEFKKLDNSDFHAYIPSTEVDTNILHKKKHSMNSLSNFESTHHLANCNEMQSQAISSEMPFYFSIEPETRSKTDVLYKIDRLNFQSLDTNSPVSHDISFQLNEIIPDLFSSLMKSTFSSNLKKIFYSNWHQINSSGVSTELENEIGLNFDSLIANCF